MVGPVTGRKRVRTPHARWSGTLSCGHYVLRGTPIYGRPGSFKCEACWFAARGTALPGPRPRL
jgi:hypothetical protein